MLLKNRPRNEYRLKDGTLVPGVTTVIGEWRKPALDKWHWEEGFSVAKEWFEADMPELAPLSFKEWRERSMDATAGVGTICHYKIHCWLLGKAESYDPKFDKAHIDAANIPFREFQKYYSFRQAQVLLSEYSLVHEAQRYGGTLDLLVGTKEGIELWDVKTAKAIWDEYWIQLSAYKGLLDQDSKWRHHKITSRIVLVTKDGRCEAPAASKSYLNQAHKTWMRQIKTYHELKRFRDMEQGALNYKNWKVAA